MANILNKTGITTGNTVEAYHVTQSIDAFSGTADYDIFLSGSFNMTGSINGQPGIINPLTASFAISSSRAISSSFATTSSHFLGAIGTGQYLPVWSGIFPTSSNTLINSSIFQDLSGSIMIGAVGSVGSRLYVNHSGVSLGGITIVNASVSPSNISLSLTNQSPGTFIACSSGSTSVFTLPTNGAAILSGSLRIVNPTTALSTSGNVIVTGSLTATANLTVNSTSSLKGIVNIGNGSNGTLIIPLNGTVNTSNATPTTLLTLPTTTGLIYTVTGKIIGFGDSDQTIGGDIVAVFKNAGGSLSQVGSSVKNVIEDFTLSPTFDLVASGNNILLQVTGVTSVNITWAGQIQYISYNSNV